MELAVGLRRILIVTLKTIVGEDLREALFAYTNAEVDLVPQIEDSREEAFDVAIFGLPLDRVLHDRRVRSLHNAGTQIVILNGHYDPRTLDGTGIRVLAQPFSTEDVYALMDDVIANPRRKA